MGVPNVNLLGIAPNGTVLRKATLPHGYYISDSRDTNLFGSISEVDFCFSKITKACILVWKNSLSESSPLLKLMIAERFQHRNFTDQQGSNDGQFLAVISRRVKIHLLMLWNQGFGSYS
jgi:hypothetical protein